MRSELMKFDTSTLNTVVIVFLLDGLADPVTF